MWLVHARGISYLLVTLVCTFGVLFEANRGDVASVLAFGSILVFNAIMFQGWKP